MGEKVHPWCSNVQRDEAIRAAEDAAAAERTPPPEHRELPAAVAELRERVGRLEAVTPPREAAPDSRPSVNAAPAANAGGEANQEPMAWGVKWDGKAEIDGEFLYTQKEFAHEVLANNYGRGTVVPLFAEPQPPRGWLTPEERACIEELLPYTFSGVQAKRLTMLLASETPPRVKVPDFVVGGYRNRDEAWIAAIRAAGGEVG